MIYFGGDRLSASFGNRPLNPGVVAGTGAARTRRLDVLVASDAPKMPITTNVRSAGHKGLEKA